jgi:Concanavalin A-like lectin/glucanases superfamily
VPACVGLALQLDGATFAAVPRVVDNDFTLEAWIKTEASLTGLSASNGRAIFDSDVIGMGSMNDFAVSVLNDRIAFGVGGPDSSVQGLTVVTSDAWVHVAVTRRAATGQLQVFVNGALDAVATAPNRAPLAARPDLAFGGFSASRKFIGAIDEVRVWNVLRSDAQISGNMRERLSGSEEGLVGYYVFEDRGTVETADASAMGVTATLTGNPTYVTSTALCAPGQEL